MRTVACLPHCSGTESLTEFLPQPIPGNPKGSRSIGLHSVSCENLEEESNCASAASIFPLTQHVPPAYTPSFAFAPVPTRLPPHAAMSQWRRFSFFDDRTPSLPSPALLRSDIACGSAARGLFAVGFDSGDVHVVEAGSLSTQVAFKAYGTAVRFLHLLKVGRSCKPEVQDIHNRMEHATLYSDIRHLNSPNPCGLSLTRILHFRAFSAVLFHPHPLISDRTPSQ